MTIRTLLPAVLRRLPRALSYKLWQRYGRRQHGRMFQFTTAVEGTVVHYGGVLGFSSDALFADLNVYESEAFALVRHALASLWAEHESIEVLDVGANNGQWLLKLKAMDSRFAITCFEPFEQLCQFLQQLVRSNQFDQVVIHQMAVDERPGEQLIHYQTGATDTASMDPQFLPASNKQQFSVQTVSLDGYCENSECSPDLIKIDVELFECEVLAGADGVLRRCRPLVIFESLHSHDPVIVAKQDRIGRQMSELDYHLFHLCDEPRLTLTPGLKTDPSYRFNNVLALPSEKLPQFQHLIETL